MIGPEDARWVKSTANELNNLLQVISEASQFLVRSVGENQESIRYQEMLQASIARSANLVRMLLVRVGERGPAAAPAINPEVAPTSAPAPAAPSASAPSFPKQPAPAASSPPAGAETDLESGMDIFNPRGFREMIMLVDDEDFITQLAQRMLVEEGYKVVIARDGYQALKIYTKLRQRIDLIILDFTMPIMDGSEVFDELLMINPRVPVVLSSGFAEQDKVKTMLAKGLRGFMPKPYTQQKLLSQVRSTLDALKIERTK